MFKLSNLWKRKEIGILPEKVEHAPPEIIKSDYEKVQDFHQAFKLPINSRPKLPVILGTARITIKNELVRTIERLHFLTTSLKQSNRSKNSRLRRIRIMVEEFTEYLEAEHSGNLVEIADALIDLEYVTLGTHLEYGLPQPKLFKEVHNANMAKLDVAGEPIKDEGGKILKPEGWQRPNIKRIIGHD